MYATEIEDGLWIGDAQYVEHNEVDEEFDVIISLCRSDPMTDEECPIGTMHIPLWDDDVYQQDRFDEAVIAVLNEMSDDSDLLVHCIAGQSRSPAVVATAIAARDDIPWDDAASIIWEERPTIAIHNTLREHGKRFLHEP